MRVDRVIPMVVLSLLMLLGQSLGLRGVLGGLSGVVVGSAAESCAEDAETAGEADASVESCPCCTPFDSCGCGMGQAPVQPRPTPEPARVASGQLEIKALNPETTGVPARFGAASPRFGGHGAERGAIDALTPTRARLCVRQT